MIRPLAFFLVVWAMGGPMSLAAYAEEAAAKNDAPKTETGKPSDKKEGEVVRVEAEQTRGFSPAELEILQNLEEKKTELDRREQALELREKLVDLMEKRLAERVEEMTQLKAQLELLTKNLSGKEEGELNHLAQMYAAMKPAAAAVVLNRLDNNIVFDVLKRMPIKKSGKIMEALEPVKARVISEMMAEPVLVVPKNGTTPSPTTPLAP